VSDAVRDSIVVNADPDTILDVVADLEAYPEWQAEVKGVEVLETDDDGWPTKARLDVDVKVAQASMVLEYSYGENEMRWRLLEGKGLTRNDGAYILDDRGDGTTQVTYEVEIETNLKVPSMVRRQVAKRVVDTALKQMKRRVESQ
jgi:uncharacterized membrane protein